MRLQPLMANKPYVKSPSTSSNQLAALGLLEPFLNVIRNRPSLFFGPVFFGVLRFKGATKNVFGVFIRSRGEPLFDECLNRWEW